MWSIGWKHSETRLKSNRKIWNHLIILTIGEGAKWTLSFFSCVDKDEILNKVLNLDASAAFQDSDVPSRIIKENADIFTDFLNSSCNNSIYQPDIPSILKLENVISVFRKGDRNSKENSSKKSLNDAVYSIQYHLWLILEQWKNVVDKWKCFGALITDLSIAFVCLCHELLITKLKAYGFDLQALKLNSKLRMKQKTKDQNQFDE